MSLTAFVTGASGFVGSHLVRELDRQGWEVHLLARATSSLDEIGDVRYTRHVGDVTDPGSIEAALPRGADAVFHVAASTNLWSRNNSEQTRINVDGTHNLLVAAIETGAKRFIHTSSFVTWGFTGTVFNEDSERTTRSDWINYVRTKHLSEQQVLDAARDGQLDAVVLNPANVLGPGDWRNWSRLFQLIYQNSLPGAPPAGGSFCDVREVARAHVAAFHEGRTGQRYLLGGQYARFMEVISIAGEILDRRVPTRPTPVPLWKAYARLMAGAAWFSGKEPDLTPEAAEMTSHDLVCDSSKAERELDYRSVPLRDMIVDTIDWMRERRLLR
jgi:nucleoside-diphosphate-sugar epimerase